jgi:uncharacterized protein YozE (UPF0346 family)
MGSRNTKSLTRPVATAQSVKTIFDTTANAKKLLYDDALFRQGTNEFDTLSRYHSDALSLLKQFDKANGKFVTSDIVTTPEQRLFEGPLSTFAHNTYVYKIYKNIAQSIVNNPQPNQTLFSRIYPELITPSLSSPPTKKNTNLFISKNEYTNALSTITSFLTSVNRTMGVPLINPTQKEINANITQIPHATRMKYLHYTKLRQALAAMKL